MSLNEFLLSENSQAKSKTYRILISKDPLFEKHDSDFNLLQKGFALIYSCLKFRTMSLNQHIVNLSIVIMCI